MTQAERDRTHVGHMLEAANAVRAYTKGGKARFKASKMVQDAVTRQLEILGEAARRLSQPFRDANPQVPWRSIIGMRNILIHAYDDVDLEKVWDAVGITVNQVSPLLQELVGQPAEDAGSGR